MEIQKEKILEVLEQIHHPGNKREYCFHGNGE